MNETCVNLAERFGDRYRLTFDPADERERKDSRSTDPWYLQVRCRRGTIYPHGGDTLAVEVDGHRNIVRQLKGLPCCRVHQLGDADGTFLFDVQDFDTVAAIVLPYRRPALSDDRREALRQQAADLHNSRRAVALQKPTQEGVVTGVKSPV